MVNRKTRILAIDDNMDNLIIIKALIQEKHPSFSVFTALSGQEGLEIAAKEDPDVILLDIVMPIMDGYEVCRRLKADKRLRDIPVVFVTALKDDKKSRILALECGAEAFLSKPIDESELTAQIFAMIKIRDANHQKQNETKRLSQMVAEKTLALELANRNTLALLQEVKDENAKRRKSEHALLEAQRLSHIGSFEHDIANNRMYWTEEGLNIYGVKNELALQSIDLINEYTHPEDRDFVILTNEQAMREKRSVDYCFRIIRSDGEVRHLELRYLPEFNENDILIRTVGTIQDITELKQAETALKESECRLLAAQKMAHVGNWELDLETNLVWASEESFHIYGIERISEYLSIKTVQETAFPEYRRLLDKKLINLIKGRDTYDVEFKIRKVNTGAEVFVHSIAVLQVDHLGKPYKITGTIQDITGRKIAENKLEYFSYHDHLTGLYNRRYFEKEVRRLDAGTNMPVSVIIGDINGLKLVNDAVGHAEGDNLIVKTAEIIRDVCNENAVLARTGGDEFSVLLPNTDSQTALQLINEIQSACDTYNRKIRNDSKLLSIAMGCATKETMGQIFSQVIKTAESYMYKRKLLERKSVHSSLIASIKTTLFEKSHETQEHADRLIELSQKLGNALGLNVEQLNELELLSALHDIGKISIPDKILDKPSKLTDEEWMEMKKHPETGYRIAMASPELKIIAEYILCHHERWDGNGYPQGLKNDQIPLLSRVLSVVDSYDAMTQDRPYRQAMPAQNALREIEENAGTQFDPEIANLFIEIMVRSR